MATSWLDHYAKCPFYLRGDHEKGRWTISCQGVTDASILQWRFRTKQDLEIQFKTFCCGKFERCEVYEMLGKTFEEDEE